MRSFHIATATLVLCLGTLSPAALATAPTTSWDAASDPVNSPTNGPLDRLWTATCDDLEDDFDGFGELDLSSQEISGGFSWSF